MKIGITYTGTDAKHDNYYRWIAGEEDITIIKLSEDLNNLEDVLSCDGIVLSGGIDITPSIYGGEDVYTYAPEVFNYKRDVFELAIFKITQEKNIPVLGVCRGMQLVNCYYGGTLKQDLEQKNAVHKITEVSDKQHHIFIEPGSAMAEIVGDKQAAVNSAHHQAIDKVGSGLIVTATSGDGVPEALERSVVNDQPFLLCIQWHPERMYHFNLQHTAPAAGVRTKFLNEIKKNKNGHY
jgi:putative glutamine amidotransferase